MKVNTTPLHPKIVLGIAAHPDDLDFGASGTMARYAQEGADVHYLILTDGSKGSSDRSLLPLTLAKMREEEQRAAVKQIGGKSVQFLGFPDAELEVTMELKRQIVRVIRTIKPDIVITMDPSMLYSAERGFINHPDHRAAGQAALDAVFPLARDHLSFPELFANGLEPHSVSTMLLIHFNDPNYIVDISDTFDHKLNALNAHTSQIADMEATTKWVTAWAKAVGKQANFEKGEAFVRIDIR